MNRILIVDDDEAFLNTLSRLLAQTGLAVTSTNTVQEARRLISTESFTHALLDLNLAGDSGLKLLPFLVDEQPNCHIVMLTGYASIATTVEAMRIGAADYLCKPAKIDDILEALNLNQSRDTDPDTEDAAHTPMSPKRVEWEHIQRTLLAHDGNISATARALNMHRRTLQRKLQKKPVNQ